MTRTLAVIAQARRITQPLRMLRLRPRDPSIRRIGFATFRLRRSGDQLVSEPHVDRRNTMAAFLRLLD